MVDILRQGTYALTGGACLHACTIVGVFLDKDLDPYLLWGLYRDLPREISPYYIHPWNQQWRRNKSIIYIKFHADITMYRAMPSLVY